MQTGTRIIPMTQQDIANRANAVSANDAELVWHQLFDHQVYVSGTTRKLTFFTTASADETITNLSQPAQLPAPQQLIVHNVTLDVRSLLPVTTQSGALLTVAGVLNDLALLISGYNERPTWKLKISEKLYGPFTLLTLGGSGGGVTGMGWGSQIATSGGQNQYARIDPNGGWNYFGNITIGQQQNFSIILEWAAAATMSENKLICIAMQGILTRKVQ